MFAEASVTSTEQTNSSSVILLHVGCLMSCVLKIFETFGPVSCPLYSVRFNSMEHIAEHGVEIGAKVFYVPNVSEWTHYIFLEHVKA